MLVFQKFCKRTKWIIPIIDFWQGPKFIPASNYMFKVINRNTRTRCEICSTSVHYMNTLIEPIFTKNVSFTRSQNFEGTFNITNLIHLEFIFAWTMRSKSRSGSLNHSKTKCDCAAGFLFAELKGHFWNPTFPIFFFFFQKGCFVNLAYTAFFRSKRKAKMRIF